MGLCAFQKTSPGRGVAVLKRLAAVLFEVRSLSAETVVQVFLGVRPERSTLHVKPISVRHVPGERDWELIRLCGAWPVCSVQRLQSEVGASAPVANLLHNRITEL